MKLKESARSLGDPTHPSRYWKNEKTGYPRSAKDRSLMPRDQATPHIWDALPLEGGGIQMGPPPASGVQGDMPGGEV